MTPKTVAALIVAGGMGNRFGDSLPKQYVQVHGRSLIAHTLRPFMNHARINWVQVVIHPSNREHYDEAVKNIELPEPVHGGATRQDSVRAGLEALAQHRPDYVMIHDAARPNILSADLDKLIHALDTHEDGAILVQPILDTVKAVKDGYIQETVPRETLFRAQTPQMFGFDKISKAHSQTGDMNFTDDAALAEVAGMKIKIIEGSPTNIKVTRQEDLIHVKDAYAKI